MRVLISDSDQVSRGWVRRLLSTSLAYEVVGEASNIEGTIDAAEQVQPDVVVLCLSTDSEQGLIPRLVDGTGIAVILVVVTSDGRAVWRGVNQGASGYLLKDRLASELSLGLAAMEAGGLFLSPPLARQLVDYLSNRIGPDADGRAASEISRRLLPRERETLRRLAAGQSTWEIAADMSVAESTVRTYVSRTLRKLRLRSRGEAIALAHRTGFHTSAQANAEP